MNRITIAVVCRFLNLSLPLMGLCLFCSCNGAGALRGSTPSPDDPAAGLLPMPETGARRATLHAEEVRKTPDLVAFWDFQEPGGEDRVSKGPVPYRLREQAGAVERIAPRGGAPFGPHAALLKERQWLRVPRTEMGDLDIHGPDARVTVIAWLVRHMKSDDNCEAVAGVWDEPLNKRQYCLFISIPRNKHHPLQPLFDRVSGHVSDVGGPTPGFPKCRDVARSRTAVPHDEWPCIGFTYDGKEVRAYYNGRFELFEGNNPYAFPNGIYDGGREGVAFRVGVSDEVRPSRNWFAGVLGGLAVFKRALGDEEMLRLAVATEELRRSTSDPTDGRKNGVDRN